MNIRLHGTDTECRAAAAALVGVIDVESVSRPFPDRLAPQLVRVYVDTRLRPPAAASDAKGPR